MMIMVERVGLRIKGKHDRSSTKINKIQTSKSLNHTLGKGEKRKETVGIWNTAVAINKSRLR